MKRELHYFDIYPKVVPAGAVSAITIRCVEPRYRPADGAQVTIKVIPMTQNHGNNINGAATYQATAAAGTLKFSHEFPEEQEYDIRVYLSENEYARLAVYALEPDLYALTPLKGDFHAHTTYSDGWESPEAVAGYYREQGFDFMVISDHSNYAGSLQAQNFYAGVSMDFNIVAGEEVHAPGNHVHIVHFGGEHSVNELFLQDPEKYAAQVKAIEDNLDPALVFANARERHVYASCLWVYEKIREARGLSIFAHPFWINDVYNVSDSLTRLMFKTKCFDAFELVGGQTPKENNLQLAFYHTACKEGWGDVPIVGSSDSHGAVIPPFERSRLTGGAVPVHGAYEFFSIVLAAGNTKDEIIDAVKRGNVAAVEWYAGESARVHGDFRMVRYVIFLLEEYFPLHDEICREEGRLMRSLAYGKDENAVEELERKAGQVARMGRKYFRGAVE